MNFRYRLMQFMSGRYGPDKLFYAISVTAMVLAFINIFIRIWEIQLVVYGLLCYGLFRCMSRNISARAKENRWFIDKIHFLKHRKEMLQRQQADKAHIYKKCPSCKAVLRLPRRVGKHTTVCPKCGKEFKVTVRR